MRRLHELMKIIEEVPRGERGRKLREKGVGIQWGVA
jgi:hypothetical protein